MPALTLPREFAVKVLTKYVPLDFAWVVVTHPQVIHINGGRDTLNVSDAGNGKVTIQ